MTLSVDFVGFAEAAAIDPRGNLMTSGFMPQFFAVDSFPGQIAPWFIVIAEGESDEYGDAPNTVVDLKVNGPDGETLFFVQQEQPVGKNVVEGFPPRLVLAAQIPVIVGKPGTYEFILTVRLPAGDLLLEASKGLRLVDGSRLKPASSA